MSAPERKWPLYKNCLQDHQVHGEVKQMVCMTFPRCEFQEKCTTFADVRPDWLKIARVYFRLLKELALEDSHHLTVILEAVRDTNGVILDYTFFALYSGDKDINAILAGIMKDAWKKMKKIEDNKTIPIPEDFRAVGSFGNTEWHRLLFVYWKLVNTALEAQATGELSSLGNLARATSFFAFTRAFAIRSRRARFGQAARAAASYLLSMAEFGDQLDTVLFPYPEDIYKIRTTDVLSGNLEKFILPEIQCAQISQGVVFLPKVVEIYKVEESRASSSSAEFATRATAASFADLESRLQGFSVVPEEFLGEAPESEVEVDADQRSIYSILADEARCELDVIRALVAGKGSFSSVPDPRVAARRLYLEMQEKALQRYTVYCRGNFPNLSPAGRILARFLKEGRANFRGEPLAAGDRSLGPFANYQARLLRRYVECFKATETSAVYIEWLRCYMTCAFFLGKRLFLNAIMNSATGARSKSFCAQAAASTFPDLVVVFAAYMSEKALFGDIDNFNLNQLILIFDDNPPEMLGQNSHYNTSSGMEAKIKYITSRAEVSALRNEDDGTGKRITKHVFAEASHSLILLNNIKMLRSKAISDAIDSRFLVREVSESEGAKVDVMDMMYAALREGSSSVKSGEVSDLRRELWSQAALAFEAGAMIGSGVLQPITDWVAGVMLPFLSEYLEERGHDGKQIRNVERVVNFARVRCLQDAVYTTFFAPGAEFRGVPYDPSQMKALDHKLVISVQHLVSSIGEQADLILNPHEKPVVEALGKIWWKQPSHLFWASGVDGDQDDCTYLRFELKGSDRGNFGGREWREEESGPAKYLPLANAISRLILAEDETGQHSPSVDEICLFLDSLCRRTASCRQWKKRPVGTGGGESARPLEPNNEANTFEVTRLGESSRKVRDLAHFVNKNGATAIAIQADYLCHPSKKTHTEILADGIKECLSRRGQSPRRLLFCPNYDHPSVYDVIDVPGGTERSPLLKVRKPPVGDGSGPFALAIEEDLDVIAHRIRNEALFVTEAPVSLSDPVDDGEEPLLFFSTRIRDFRIAAEDAADMFAELSLPSEVDFSFDDKTRAFGGEGEVHLSSLSESDYRTIARVPAVANELFNLKWPYERPVDYPKQLLDVLDKMMRKRTRI